MYNVFVVKKTVHFRTVVSKNGQFNKIRLK
jgi:hypothetical protein